MHFTIAYCISQAHNILIYSMITKADVILLAKYKIEKLTKLTGVVVQVKTNQLAFVSCVVTNRTGLHIWKPPLDASRMKKVTTIRRHHSIFCREKILADWTACEEHNCFAPAWNKETETVKTTLVCIVPMNVSLFVWHI